VLELGPGDNIGVAIRFASAGTAFVSAIDKFVPLHDSPHHRKLYTELRDRYKRLSDADLMVEGIYLVARKR
jgi:hypothetical protein